MKSKNYLLLVLMQLIFISSLFFSEHNVSADELPGKFGVQAILPTNQVDKSVSYFDLLVKPGQEQTLEIELQNLANKEREFEINVNPAVTSDGGTIDYGQKNPKLDQSIPFDLRKYIILDRSTVKIKAKESIKVPIKMNLPNKKFSGRMLAGITVIPKDKNEKKRNSKESKKKSEAKIINRLSYSVALVIQQSGDKVTPNLNLQSAQAKPFNSIPYISFNFQNPSGTIINNLVFKTKVYRNGKIFIKNTSNPFLVAPNTNFNLRLDLDGQKVKPGNYRAIIEANSKNKKWIFEKKFLISSKKASAVNNNTVYGTNDINWGLIVLVVIIIILIITIIIVVIHRKSE